MRFLKNGPKIISLVEKRHWNAICACTISYSHVDSNVHIFLTRGKSSDCEVCRMVRENGIEITTRTASVHEYIAPLNSKCCPANCYTVLHVMYSISLVPRTSHVFNAHEKNFFMIVHKKMWKGMGIMSSLRDIVLLHVL